MTSDENPADTVVEQAWGEFRDGPDYQPSDRYDVRSVFEAGFRAALADPADRDEESVQASVQPASELASYFFDRCFGIVDDPEAKLVALIEARDVKIRNEAHR